MASSTKVAIGLLIFVAILALAVSLTFFQIDKISEIKNEEYVGKEVMVRGEVDRVLKIGDLSGYSIEDETGSISVSSEELPVEGEMITVKGTLIRDTLFGYYIKTA